MSSTSVTTTIIEVGEDSKPFMLPGMAAPEHLNIDAGTRVVRFDRECVLIPQAPKQKRGMVVTRSYTLPLWKRRGRQSDFEPAEEPTGIPPSPENTRVIIKVPIPTSVLNPFPYTRTEDSSVICASRFRRRSSRSPARGRSVSTSPTVPYQLTPCLVHRDPSTSPEIPSRAPSRPSLPIYHRRQNDITVPLRECCQACERITEECIREGDLWKEQFSRGARRRRSVSLDQHESLTKIYTPLHIKATNCTKVYSAVVPEDDALGMEANPRCGFSLTVDEVDKRRKSLDLAVDHCHRFHDRGSPPSPGPSSSFNSHERDLSSSSTSSLAHSDELIPDVLDSRHCLRSSPIEEEDEAELFPLPRRTPSASPSPKASPSPSPNGSTSCLPSSVVGLRLNAACSSKESIASNSSHDGLLKASLTRKFPGGVGLGFPHGTVQTSSKSSLFTATSAASMNIDLSRPLPPLPDSDSGSSASNDNTHVPLFPSITISDVDLSSTSTSALSPSSPPDSIPILETTKPIQIPPSSPISSHQNTVPYPPVAKRKLSFTAPFVKAGGTIKGVSADVLKGVNSITAVAPF